MTDTDQPIDDPHPGETSLLSAIANGATTWSGRTEPTTFDPDAGPNPDDWIPPATIRADLVRQLLTGQHPGVAIARRLRIHGARIIGHFELQDTSLTVPVEFNSRWFDHHEPVDMDYASTTRITITNGWLSSGFTAKHVVTRAVLDLTGSRINGETQLSGARVGGELKLIGGHSTIPAGRPSPGERADRWWPVLQ